MNHSSNDLIMLFNDLFREANRTILVSGSSEPEYVPAGESEALAQVMFTYDYYASALHEISHWCIAGEHRRTLHDYGYWYCPDGRTVKEQQAFEGVEVKPQAIEWLFSVAAGYRFHISTDNLAGAGSADPEGFCQKVRAQAGEYLARGLPPRAQTFIDLLATFYGTGNALEVRWREDARRVAPLHSESEHSQEN